MKKENYDDTFIDFVNDIISSIFPNYPCLIISILFLFGFGFAVEFLFRLFINF